MILRCWTFNKRLAGTERSVSVGAERSVSVVIKDHSAGGFGVYFPAQLN